MRTVLIVDNHASFRAIARAALSERFAVVSEASDPATALDITTLVRTVDWDGSSPRVIVGHASVRSREDSLMRSRWCR